ncbi:uncharacterized protein LOC122818852 isoform X2 [Drosophila biarmipes]|uniref:uncharacterized protein LOC122818852 isoform X2 n=1 Tax=Drosophila biarmipes TaxID=125945 RepID=UPI0021CC4FC6|nr:uncharacterized protein LOC122818852 isoform X2 [Drosophila biarmipes]
MKSFALLLVALSGFSFVMAVLRKPQTDRDNGMAFTVRDRDIPEDTVIEAFRRKLYDKIEAVKWKSHIKLWADLGIDALSHPISKLNEMVNSVGHHPTYEVWLAQLRKKIWEKGQHIVVVMFQKVNKLFTVLHAHLKKKVDKVMKKKSSDYGGKHGESRYIDYDDYIRE